ncbi:MAG: hypothetical protein U1F68_17660 [Gammaproteobacteria bacterium]
MGTDIAATLQQGIWLENLGVLLPWQIQHQELIKLGKPVIKTGSVHDEVYWYDCTILGGIALPQLRALLEPRRVHPAAATPSRWCFQGVSACVAMGERQGIIDCAAQVAGRLKKSLGNAIDEASIGGYFYWAKWQFGATRVAVWTSEGDDLAPHEHSCFICCDQL